MWHQHVDKSEPHGHKFTSSGVTPCQSWSAQVEQDWSTKFQVCHGTDEPLPLSHPAAQDHFTYILDEHIGTSSETYLMQCLYYSVQNYVQIYVNNTVFNSLGWFGECHMNGTQYQAMWLISWNYKLSCRSMFTQFFVFFSNSANI